jgi:ribonuclease HI
MQKHWHLYTDGASRNNPGPAGAGICIMHEGKIVKKQGHYVGTKTNNQAEYLALLLGIFYAKAYVQKGDQLAIFADSQLLVRQMQGVYKVKNSDLQVLQRAAFTLLMPYDYALYHVYREENTVADEMANEGLDKKIVVPSAFTQEMRIHGISL